MNLYEINSEYQVILSKAEEYAEQHEGEILPDMATALELVSGQRMEKIENCLKYYKNEQAKAEMVNSELVALKMRSEQHERNAERIKLLLASIIGSGNKFEFGCGKIGWRASSSVEILNSEIIPDSYVRIVPEKREPDKNLIKQTLKSGAEIPGVKLVESQNIQIK